MSKPILNLVPETLGDPEYPAGGRAVRPRDAATLIIVRRDGTQPRVLMGQRAAGHIFMPNMFVFPGGRVDPGDDWVKPSGDLHPAVRARLTAHCSQRRARGLAMAAIRETWEETSLLLGEPHASAPRTRSPVWREFLSGGYTPRLDTLHYIGRAITPPHRNRRFDARFFMAEADLVTGRLPDKPKGSGELIKLSWFNLDQADALELAHITRYMLAEVRRRLDSRVDFAEPGPFVYARRGKIVVDTV
ncbi:MAG: NUDIX hydrolase [Pseudomonadota bacterium]